MWRSKPIEFETYNTRQLRERLAVLTVGDIQRGTAMVQPVQVTHVAIVYLVLAGGVGFGLMVAGLAIFMLFLALPQISAPVTLFGSIFVHSVWMILCSVFFAKRRANHAEVYARVDRCARVQASLLRSVLSLCPDGSKVHVPKPLKARMYWFSDSSKDAYPSVDWTVTIATQGEECATTLSLHAREDRVWVVTVEAEEALPRRLWHVLSKAREEGQCRLYDAEKKRIQGEFELHTEIRRVEVELGEWSSWESEDAEDRDVLQAAILSLKPVRDILRVVCPRHVQYDERGTISAFNPSRRDELVYDGSPETQPRVLVSSAALHTPKSVREEFEYIHQENQKVRAHSKALRAIVWGGACLGALVFCLTLAMSIDLFDERLLNMYLVANASISLAVGFVTVSWLVPQTQAYQSYSAKTDTALNAIRQEVVVDGAVIRLGASSVDLSSPFQETFTRDPDAGDETTGVVTLTLRHTQGDRRERVSLRIRVERSTWFESLPLLQTRGLLIDGEEFDRWIAPVLAHFRAMHGSAVNFQATAHKASNA